ncbi:glycosyltransferase family 2 protein [Salinibacter ruber]|uniref:glycosyltransferase family 2 protein n=1 Tax=Salinibacter ruber TaxID=146919 RepID=UPI002168DE25|nr:glycosyltransferase family 2 protein [Salinibacter ruber]MCS4188218.1 glycosyltransferase involved in cell wall biosynthesis [Salinibacter ruber]
MVEMLDLKEFKRRYQKVPVEEYPNRVRETVPDPLLTVHLITYNHAGYIRQAIESVLMQEVDFPMEIVLGDDDSSDGTREICIEYAEKYPDVIRLQLHHRENNRRLYGRPTHLFQYWYNTLSARGKYIAPLSGDDCWTDTCKVQKQISFLESNNEYSLTHHNAVVVRGDGEVKRGEYFPKTKEKDISGEDLVQAPVVVASSVVVRNVLSEIPKRFMSVLYEDRMITSLLGLYGKGKYFCETMSVYRKHKNGIHKSTDKSTKYKDYSDYLRAIEEIICKSKKCTRKIKRKKIEIREKRYINMIERKMFRKSINVAIKVVIKYIKINKPKKAFIWTIKSIRYMLGKVKRSYIT